MPVLSKQAVETNARDKGFWIEIADLNRIRILRLRWISGRFCIFCRRSDRTWLASVFRCHITYCRHNYRCRVSTTDNPKPGAKDRRSKYRKSVAYGKTDCICIRLFSMTESRKSFFSHAIPAHSVLALSVSARRVSHFGKVSTPSECAYDRPSLSEPRSHAARSSYAFAALLNDITVHKPIRSPEAHCCFWFPL